MEPYQLYQESQRNIQRDDSIRPAQDCFGSCVESIVDVGVLAYWNYRQPIALIASSNYMYYDILISYINEIVTLLASFKSTSIS